MILAAAAAAAGATMYQIEKSFSHWDLPTHAHTREANANENVCVFFSVGIIVNYLA